MTSDQYQVRREDLKTTIFVVYITYALRLVCNLGFYFLIFRQFPLEEVGTYGLIISLAAFAGFVMDMGISQTLIRGFSQKTLSFSQALLGSLALRIPVLAIGFSVLAFWVYLKSLLRAPDAALLALAILAQSLTGFRAVATSWLRAKEQQKRANVVDLVAPLGYLGIGISLVYFRKLNLSFLFLGTLLVEGMVTALAFSVAGKIKLPSGIRDYINFARIKAAVAAVWKPSLVFVVVGFWALMQSRLDWLMVYSYGSETELAYYSLANRVFESFDYGVCLIIQAIFPWMCKSVLTGQKNPRMVIFFKGIAALGMVLAVAIALCLPGFLKLFWGTKFEKADPMIFWLMCGSCLVPISSLMYYNLISKGIEKYLLVTSTIPTILQIAAIVVLIPRYGSFGAIIGMIVVNVSSFGLLSMYSIKNNIFEIGTLVKVITILCITLTLLIIKLYINQMPFNSPVFVIALMLGSSSLLLSKGERSMLMDDIKGFSKSLYR